MRSPHRRTHLGRYTSMSAATCALSRAAGSPIFAICRLQVRRRRAARNGPFWRGHSGGAVSCVNMALSAAPPTRSRVRALDVRAWLPAGSWHAVQTTSVLRRHRARCSAQAGCGCPGRPRSASLRICAPWVVLICPRISRRPARSRVISSLLRVTAGAGLRFVRTALLVPLQRQAPEPGDRRLRAPRSMLAWKQRAAHAASEWWLGTWPPLSTPSSRACRRVS